MSELETLYCILLSIRPDDAREDVMRAIDHALYLLDNLMGTAK